jgi:hypothetical protein
MVAARENLAWIAMVKSLLAVGLAVSVAAGVGFLGLQSLGEDAKGTLDELKSAFEKNAPGEGKASVQDAADWIERYRSGARRAACREAASASDYVCVFTDGDARLRKIGLIVGSKQPTQMSPLLGARRRLPNPTA